ncbi:MAG: hypothetical protein ACXAC5_04970 [Promethearchaeota archaeon]|jgi:hypothetical protein
MKPEDAKRAYKNSRPSRLKDAIARIDTGIKFTFERGGNCHTDSDIDRQMDLADDIIAHYENLGWFVKLKNSEYGIYLVFYTEKPKSFWKQLWA